MADVFFISEDLLKKRTSINDNVDSGELRFAIITAQNLNVQETLGQDLYERLKLDVSGGTLTGNYKKLMDDYVVPLTISWSYPSSEQGSAVDYRTLSFLKNNAKSQAEFYDNATRKYLCANSNLYPEYTLNDDGNIQPQFGSGFRSSIALNPKMPRPYWYGKTRE